MLKDEVAARRTEVLALMNAGRYAEALPHLAWLNARPDGKDSETYFKYALCLHLAGEFRKCLAVCDEALTLYPEFSQLYALRGGTWQVFGEYDKMLEDCRRAVEIDPDNTNARYALSLRELMTSNLAHGFEGYNDRMFAPDEQPLPFFRLPSWEGEEICGKTLLIIWEQGVGDIIMFASFIPYLLAKGVRLIITVPEKLEALFARSFPSAEVVVVRDSKAEEALEKRADYSVLMGHLIELCLPEYYPAEHSSYLKADEKEAAVLRRKYLARDAGKPYLVGVAWHTTNPMTGQLRTIPLEQWGAIFAVPGIQFISLQYGEHGVLPEAVYHDDSVDAFADVDALAAQIAAMDEVITIQNATAHLAGALGVRATLLLSSASDWRWGIHQDKGAWYDSVTIIRQQEPLAWQPVLEQVAAGLAYRSK